MTESALRSASGPSFAESFAPKFVTALREGYRLAQLRADALAGATAAIVALPLSMAIAIASGAQPLRRAGAAGQDHDLSHQWPVLLRRGGFGRRRARDDQPTPELSSSI